MYTQCPHCLSVFEPTPYQLARGRGRLQCGVCSRDFDALERLGAQPIHAAALPVPAASSAPRIDPEASPEQGLLFAPPRPEAPAFAQRTTRVRRAGRDGAWWVGCGALTLVLAAQMVLAQRAELARHATWRPWLERVCSTLGCDLPAWRDTSTLRLLARDVRPHPSVPGALTISATFRNDAPWPQDWPMLEIALSDLEGQPLALRRFKPEEYLGAEPRESTLSPGQSAAATLEVQDPGNQAVAFAFEFR